MRKLFFTVFVGGAIASIGCSGNNNSNPSPPTTTTTQLSQQATDRDSAGNPVGGPAPVNQINGVPAGPTGGPTPPQGTTVKSLANKLQSAIHTSYSLNPDTGRVSASGGSAAPVSAARLDGETGASPGSSVEDRIERAIASNATAGSGGAAVHGGSAHFESFVKHQDFSNSDASLGDGSGGSDSVGGRSSEGAGSAQ